MVMNLLFFQDFPWYQVMILMILFSWLRMGEICASPFDGDSIYDLKAIEIIDSEIYAASLALQTAEASTDITDI